MYFPSASIFAFIGVQLLFFPCCSSTYMIWMVWNVASMLWLCVQDHWGVEDFVGFLITLIRNDKDLALSLGGPILILSRVYTVYITH